MYIRVQLQHLAWYIKTGRVDELLHQQIIK